MRWTALRAVLPALGAILWVLEQAGGAVSAMPRAELTFQQVVVSIMLFDSWSVEHQGTWKGHPFHASNNIDGINGDPDNNGLGIETHTLKIPAVTKLQEA